MKLKTLFCLFSILGSLQTLATNRQEIVKDINCKKSHKIAFFDADSTLRISKSGNVSANYPKDVIILPNVAKQLKKIAKDGYIIAIVSNQGGVSKGFVSLETAEMALAYTKELIEEQGGIVHYFDFAENYDEFRKPNIGMATKFETVLKTYCAKQGIRTKIDLKHSYMVGDSGYKKKKDLLPNGLPGFDFSNSDRLFAENLGIPFYYAADYFKMFHDLLNNYRILHTPDQKN